MRTVVCVKQVLQLGDEVEFTDDGRDVDPDYLDPALNEWDSFATEEALQLRERRGGEVVVVTCGDEAVGGGPAALPRDGCRPGDPGRRVPAATRSRSRGRSRTSCGRRAPTSCSAASSRATPCRRRPGPRSPSCSTCRGRRSSRSSTTPAPERRSSTVSSRAVSSIVVEVDTPAVLTIQTGINEPRYATLRAIKQAEQVEIDVRSAAGGGTPAYRVRRMFVPERGEGAEMIDGSPAEIAARIAAIVKERLA